ncbi:MAG TPA: OsmC family protein [Puia sp.]|jgi:putative redox protein|nr:OsmC family protein [Puia sp.]
MFHVEVFRVNNDFGFEGKDASGHTVKMDSSPESGGHNFGIRPMQMLLMGLGGCSGIDIVSILKKQKQTVEEFRILIDGEREAGKDPTLWKYIKIIFELKGNIEPEKAKRACDLSIEKYCSVAATLMGAGCKIHWETKIIS